MGRRSLPQAPLVVLLASVVLLAGCEIDSPSVPDEDDELAGVIGHSSDTLFPPGERRRSGEVLMAPLDQVDELVAGTAAQRRSGDDGDVGGAGSPFHAPEEQVRELEGARIAPLQRGAFTFDGVDAGSLLLCHLRAPAETAPPGSIRVAGCAAVEVEPPMSVKLMSSHGTLEVIESSRDE